MQSRIAQARLYGILDTTYVGYERVQDITRQLIDGGVDLLQLRAKEHGPDQIQELAELIMPLTGRAQVPLIINDHPEIVPAVGAQGAHVGQDDLSVADARWRAGRALNNEVPPVLIGKSTHCPEQAIAAEADGADYIGFGPLFETPTKPRRPAIGLADIASVHARLRIPVFCIGGIHRDNLARVIDAGARRVVIVSALLTADNIPAYAAECRALLDRA